jgi:hypothetical protein
VNTIEANAQNFLGILRTSDQWIVENMPQEGLSPPGRPGSQNDEKRQETLPGVTTLAAYPIATPQIVNGPTKPFSRIWGGFGECNPVSAKTNRHASFTASER